MDFLAIQLFNGLVNGAFYALLSLGLAVIFGMMRIVNFAHGAFYMLGAFVAYVALQQGGIGFWPSLVIAPLAIALAGMVLERLLIRRIAGVDPLFGFLLTFGLSLLIQDAMRLRFGLQGQPYATPAELAGTVSLGAVTYPTYRLFVIAFSLAVSLAVWYAIERTRLGMVVRAATERAELTRALGVDVDRWTTPVFGFGLGLARVLYPVLALDILVWGLFAMSIDLLLGFGGLLSFGHAAYWGVAGYAAGLVARDAGMPFPVAALAGVVASAALAVPLGYLSLRRTGIYFAMVTLAFAQMLFYVANEARPLTGGENGLQGIPRTLGGLPLGPSMSFYYAALPLVLLGYLAAYRIVT